MELSQRTGQLLITCLLGRGTPLFIKANLPRCKGCVKDAMVWSYAVGGWRSASLEVGGRGQERNDAAKRRHGDAARKAKDRG
jgi:hypothetical protein